jgi:hypothetical protein
VELGRVAAEEEHVEKERRLGALFGSVPAEAEMLLVPARLACNGLEQERVDLRQRVVARQAAERVRKGGVAARVVERVPRLVQEPLVIVEATLGARDQVHDLRRVRGDHAGTRVFLRAIVEVEADTSIGREIEAESGECLETHGHCALLRVHVRERRQPAQVRDVVGGGLVLGL